MTSLFDPIAFGAIAAPNRIMMAPLTRGRATRSHVPTPLMAEYYSQRASAGLIISEATGITQQGLGLAGRSGALVRGAGRCVEARSCVRSMTQAGRIVAQLWHMGRIVHPDFLGGRPTSVGFGYAYHRSRECSYIRRAPSLTPNHERWRYTKLKRSSATTNWRPSTRWPPGFDGVQLHAANGYPH